MLGAILGLLFGCSSKIKPLPIKVRLKFVNSSLTNFSSIPPSAEHGASDVYIAVKIIFRATPRTKVLIWFGIGALNNNYCARRIMTFM